MSADSKVSVKVGKSGSLDFTLSDVERSGYFAYVEDSHTLTATFSGTVEGYPSSETKAYDNVQPGTHYKITFRLHDAGEDDPGFIAGDDIVVVDASVTTEDMNVDVDPGETPVEDDLRPKEDDEDEPTPPVPGLEAPSITAEEPCSLDRVNLIELDENGDSKYPVVLIIDSSSEDGITEFKVKIDSTTLTPDELDSVGLCDVLDLVNTSSQPYGESLAGLGFPTDVGGQTHVEFMITGFIPMLDVLGPGTHKFILTVTDAHGTTERTLILQNN